MSCRLCKSSNSKEMINLGNLPLANSLKNNIEEKESFYPLSTQYCFDCMFMQINVDVDKKNIFNKSYIYQSGYSSSWIKHCESYSKQIIKDLNLNSESFVLEIACNDGTLLDFFKKKKIQCLGVEPSETLCKLCSKKKIKTICDFLGLSLSQKIKKNYRLPDLIIANNVLAHVPNITEFVESLSNLMSNKTLLTIEFPHLLNLIKYKQFDTIYHEHYSYFSLNSLKKFFMSFNLNIIKFEKINVHGGSLRIYVKKDSSYQNREVIDFINMEKKSCLNSQDLISNFNIDTNKIINDAKDFLQKNKEKKIVGYGAAAKASTFLNFCNLDREIIPYICDSNVSKVGKYISGTRCKIINPLKLKQLKPDIIVIFAWNVKDEIKQNVLKIVNKEVIFVSFIPKITVE